MLLGARPHDAHHTQLYDAYEEHVQEDEKGLTGRYEGHVLHATAWVRPHM